MGLDEAAEGLLQGGALADPEQGWREAPAAGLHREILTNALEEPLGLVLPGDPKKVDGQAAEDYAKANATLLGGLPEGDSNQEQAGQDEEHREGQVHLGTEGGAKAVSTYHSLHTPPVPLSTSPVPPGALGVPQGSPQSIAPAPHLAREWLRPPRAVTPARLPLPA